MFSINTSNHTRAHRIVDIFLTSTQLWKQHSHPKECMVCWTHTCNVWRTRMIVWGSLKEGRGLKNSHTSIRVIEARLMFEECTNFVRVIKEGRRANAKLKQWRQNGWGMVALTNCTLYDDHFNELTYRLIGTCVYTPVTFVISDSN